MKTLLSRFPLRFIPYQTKEATTTAPGTYLFGRAEGPKWLPDYHEVLLWEVAISPLQQYPSPDSNLIPEDLSGFGRQADQ